MLLRRPRPWQVSVLCRVPAPTADTTYTWILMDGYSASFDHLAAKTVIKCDECIGKEVELAWDMFRRLAKDSLGCSDNTVSGIGCSLHCSQQEVPPLPQNARAFAIQLLMRYAYVIGDSPTTFIGIKSVSQGERLLKNTDMRKDIALMCINDDLGDGDQKAANEMLRNWFERRWPEKLHCEL
ncbi:hypothetical protein B0H10DRAFT_2242320 [Mycena sp. CBHHK59/15]|nr:hypothetical protein B0H10DRAFT_2242320 [Mycena sp. CBHHK59/15]